MHTNFYDWHQYTEVQPDVETLGRRWQAVESIGEAANGDDILNLLNMALFEGDSPTFETIFSQKVKSFDPAFPKERNRQLLRVMATATLINVLANHSEKADCVALGIRAGTFLPHRADPITTDITDAAQHYLAAESERIRPKPELPDVFVELENLIESDDADSSEISSATGKAVIALGEIFSRISEENQFLWWTIGKASPTIGKRRELIPAIESALVTAMEAAQRVETVPPATSIPALIAEVLTQSADSDLQVTIDMLTDDPSRRLPVVTQADTSIITPLHGVLFLKQSGNTVDINSLKKYLVEPTTLTTCVEAALQFFHELMFLRAVALVGQT